MATKKAQTVTSESSSGAPEGFVGFTPLAEVRVLRVRMACQTTEASSFMKGDQITNGPLMGGVVTGVYAVVGGFIVDIDHQGKEHSVFLTGGDYSAEMV
jgi:hypothetical protein